MSKRQKSQSSITVLVASAAVVLTGCDFEVTNPGPIQDEFLNEPGAFEAVVNGSVRQLKQGLNYTALHGAAVARELHPTGQTGQYGIEPSNSLGYLDEDEQGTPWAATHEGRWLAEDGLRRFQEALGDAEFNAHPAVAEAYLWAAYANRLLGENMCQAVFDGGAAEPPEAFLTRAEEQFTRAIAIGTAGGAGGVVETATAARASVRVDLGDWAGAVADAAGIPTDFDFEMPYHEVGDVGQYNRIAWSSMNQPYKAHTVWGTVYEDYYIQADDPRVPWLETTQVGTGALDCCGAVPWYPQQKYTETSGIDLSTGTEMRLIEAEALLRDGSFDEAMVIVNDIRAAVGVDPWVVSTLEEAWTAFKRERGIELWLEGRRLNDLRRWQEESTPGDLDPREVPGTESHLEGQDLCFPISKAERDTNPNVG